MPESRIKLKDLAEQLGRNPKDVLQCSRDMGLPVRSTAGSFTEDEAARVRERLSGPQDEVSRTQVDSGVIVRRRRRGADGAPAESRAAAPEAAAPAAEKPAEAVGEPAAGEAPEAPAAPAASAPEAEPEAVRAESRTESREEAADAPSAGDGGDAAPAEPAKAVSVREEPAASAAPAPSAPAQEQRQRRGGRDRGEAPRARIVTPAPAAKIIRRPEEARPAPAPAEAVRAPEPAARPEAKPEAAEERKPKKPERPAVSPVLAQLRAAEDAARAERAAEREKEKAARAARARVVAQPDASARPEGSSAPTLPQRPAAAAADAQGAAGAAPATPQVRVISRPAPGSTPPRQREASGDGRGPRGDRPGGSRFPGRPGGGGPRPGGGRSGGGMDFSPAPPDMGGEGQSKKKRNKGRRTVDFQQGDFGRHGSDSEDDAPRMSRGRARRKPGKPVQPAPVTQPLKAAKRKLRVTEAIRVADMAHQMGLKANEIIKVLFGLGVMATINQSLDIETATLVAAEFDYEVERAGFSEDDYLAPQEEDRPEDLRPRPPVVTIMGHVDHGKTSLLDAIRKTNVTDGEAGGITQHIGAYHVKTRRGDIVFLDTPGHEAFTAMRARGAQITDLVILVVAADDGVMEQTREAVSHSRAANVPIIVAVNKMDKPGADPDRVLRELAELGLQPEDWGGDTIVARVSAKTREGLDELLEMVALQSEIMELRSNPNKAARGRIVEARLDKGRGPVATVLIQEGTLRQGDDFVCGRFSGRVRALMNDQGKKIKEAGPAIPAEVQGFDGVPEAGEEFIAVADEKLARRIADVRAAKQREIDLAGESKVTLETFLSRRADDQEAQTLNLVIKADVQGTLEAVTDALNKQSTEKVRVNVVHGGAGAITESDILLANASQAIIIGFNVRPTARIKDVAEHENVDIRFYDIIYKLVDDVKSAMAGLLAPVQREVYLGQAEVRQVYNLPKIGAIAGSYVADGKVARNAGARLLRDGVVVYTGRISSLKRFKDDAREVVKGNECGVGLENFNDIKVGDIIETFETVEEAATL